MKVFESYDYDKLPYKLINKLLNTELKNGATHLSKIAHKHIFDSHPKHYDFCIERIAESIKSPDYIGQSPLHKENFEIIKSFDDKFVLVAISLKQNKFGKYPIKSCYMIDANTLNRRLRTKHLKKPH